MLRAVKDERSARYLLIGRQYQIRPTLMLYYDALHDRGVQDTLAAEIEGQRGHRMTVPAMVLKPGDIKAGGHGHSHDESDGHSGGHKHKHSHD